MHSYCIAVAGTGYVGLSIATLLSQHHRVIAVDVIPEKVELINQRKSPIQDEYIEKYGEDSLLNLAKDIKVIVDDKAKYAAWSARDDIKAEFKVNIILKLADYHYPPVTVDEVYKEVLAQAINFRKYAE